MEQQAIATAVSYSIDGVLQHAKRTRGQRTAASGRKSVKVRLREVGSRSTSAWSPGTHLRIWFRSRRRLLQRRIL